jgi:uncharacterized protein with HEPN domain
MPRDDTTLIDVLEAAERAASYIEGLTRVEFKASQVVRAAVVREIEIMGEASRRLSAEFKDSHPDIPWKDLARLRDMYIHAYDRINYDRVWRAANGLLPGVVKTIRSIVPSDSGNNS